VPILPNAARPLLHSLAQSFTRPTFRPSLTLMLGDMITTGRRTFTNPLCAGHGLARGHPSSSHRVFSRRRWSLRGSWWMFPRDRPILGPIGRCPGSR